MKKTTAIRQQFSDTDTGNEDSGDGGSYDSGDSGDSGDDSGDGGDSGDDSGDSDDSGGDSGDSGDSSEDPKHKAELFGTNRKLKIVQRRTRPHKWGVSGALNPQSASAGTMRVTRSTHAARQPLTGR